MHGDDFTFLGWEEDLSEMEVHLKEFYELKVRGVMGGEAGDCPEILILGRKWSWKDGVATYEADPRHTEMICSAMGLNGTSKGLEKPSV